MIYFIDFDDVIFDDRRFKQAFKILLISLGMSQSGVDTYYSRKTKRIDSEVSKSAYLIMNIEKFFDANKFDSGQIGSEINKWLSENAKNFIFNDFFDFVSDNNGHLMYIITYGCLIWQKIKTVSSGMENYFSDRIIYCGGQSKSKILKQYLDSTGLQTGKAYFFDNRIGNIDDIKKHFPWIETFLIHKKDESAPQSQFCDHTVYDLNQANRLIKDRKV